MAKAATTTEFARRVPVRILNAPIKYRVCLIPLVLSACAGATTSNKAQSSHAIARPAVVMVSAETQPNHIPQTIAASPSATPTPVQPDARALVDAVVEALRRQDVPATAASGTTHPARAFFVKMTVNAVENGDPWKRTIVGFGWGQSSLGLHVEVVNTADNRQLLAFDVTADSGDEPGAAIAVVDFAGGGLLIPIVDGSVSVYHLEGHGTANDVHHAADAVVRELTIFFRGLGWFDWTGSPRSSLGVAVTPQPKPRPYGE
jgi:Domain of unknown function (DUF4410)